MNFIVVQSAFDMKLRKGVEVECRENDDWVRYRVIGRAGKATGKYKNFWNLQNINDDSVKELNLELTEYRNDLENSPEIGVTFHVENAFVAEIDKETYNAKLAE